MFYLVIHMLHGTLPLAVYSVLGMFSRTSITSMTTLPPNPYRPATLWSNAYNKCLIIESAAAPNTEGFSPLVRARFLGYLILKAPADEGRTNLSNEVHGCVDDAALFELASRYKLIFLRCY